MATPTPETSIWLALKARVASLALSPSLPVAWPNEAFTPPSTAGVLTNYLRVFHRPNFNVRRHVRSGGPYQRFGMLQIDLMAQQNKNVAVSTDIAGTIAAHFPSDARLSHAGLSVRVVKTDVAEGFPDEAYFKVPVSIYYEVFA